MYAVIGVARADLDFDYTSAGRYVYVAAFLLILCIVDLAGNRALGRLAPLRRRAVAIGAGRVDVGVGYRRQSQLAMDGAHAVSVPS